MITSDEELKLARENLANVEAIIESWRKDLLPHNERNFNLYARPWIDFRDEFQADIDAYLGTTTVPADRAAMAQESNDSKTLSPASEDRAGGHQAT